MKSHTLRYLGSRLVRAAATIIGIVTLVFLLVRLIPGDPIDAILGDQAAPEDRAALREALKLDHPSDEQYLGFIGHVFDGTLGTSFRTQRNVASMIAQELPHTIELAIASLAVAWLIAIPLGCIAALRRNSIWDQLASALALTGIAIPNIWLGPLLILAFSVSLQWLPLPGDDDSRLLSLILPAFTVGTALAAVLTRQTRAALSEVLQQPYVTAAHSRGIPETRVTLKYGLRNALLPVLTIGAAQIGALLSGAIITERIFERPGLGTLFLDAFFTRDIPVVQGCVLVIASIYVLVNLLLDAVYLIVDPRVRMS